MLSELINDKYKLVELKYWNEVYHFDYWIYYCVACGHYGLSRDMIVKRKRNDKDELYFSHHCARCDGLVIDPIEDDMYE